jgi:hypothetical protein
MTISSMKFGAQRRLSMGEESANIGLRSFLEHVKADSLLSLLPLVFSRRGE